MNKTVEYPMNELSAEVRRTDKGEMSRCVDVGGFTSYLVMSLLKLDYSTEHEADLLYFGPPPPSGTDCQHVHQHVPKKRT